MTSHSPTDAQAAFPRQADEPVEDRAHSQEPELAPLVSGVVTSPADGMLRRAITDTLIAPVHDRARLFEEFVKQIESFMAAHPEERPWTCRVYTGTDGSKIFRGGVGHSLVIDQTGRLWRARSYEDFDTTHVFIGDTCEIDTLTPLYSQMREYLPL
ncbi:MAG TPA: hypothetical protein VLZ81_13110 [Blastocatellia bacterium]|nr:hypothetical protein [Blastocatellia bacterium]